MVVASANPGSFETGRHMTKFERYKSCRSGNVYIFLEMYIFFVSDRAYGSQLSIIGTVAYASHLFLGDNLTNSGVKLFYPHPFTFKIPLFSTGSKFGNLIEALIVALLLLIVGKQVLSDFNERYRWREYESRETVWNSDGFVK